MDANLICLGHNACNRPKKKGQVNSQISPCVRYGLKGKPVWTLAAPCQKPRALSQRVAGEFSLVLHRHFGWMLILVNSAALTALEAKNFPHDGASPVFSAGVLWPWYEAITSRNKTAAEFPFPVGPSAHATCRGRCGASGVMWRPGHGWRPRTSWHHKAPNNSHQLLLERCLDQLSTSREGLSTFIFHWSWQEQLLGLGVAVVSPRAATGRLAAFPSKSMAWWTTYSKNYVSPDFKTL